MKVESSLCTPWRHTEVQFHSCLASAQYGGRGSALYPDRSTTFPPPPPGKGPGYSLTKKGLGLRKILNALVKRVSSCPCQESNHSSSVFQTYKEIWWGNFWWSEHMEECRDGRMAIYKLFRMRCARLQDVVMWTALSKKYYNNIRPIRNHYAATRILIYTHGCNRKFYSTCVFSYSKNKTKFMCQITPQNKDIR
jgi:hypothetical protein